MLSLPEMETFVRVVMLSAVPFVELRVGIPYGLAHGLAPHIASIAGVMGTAAEFMVSFALLVVLRTGRSRFAVLDRLFDYLDRRAEQRSKRWVRYGAAGLVLAVAMPLPGTGSWTGMAVAQLLGISLRVTFGLIILGIMLSGLLVSLLASGVIGVLKI